AIPKRWAMTLRIIRGAIPKRCPCEGLDCLVKPCVRGMCLTMASQLVIPRECGESSTPGLHDLHGLRLLGPRFRGDDNLARSRCLHSRE
ncbi:MAG: hypothetical protein WBC87_21735, partial [Pseudolabrys sp.]